MAWIEQFLQETEKIPTPEIFRKWAAITAISGALERKVWINAAGGPIYPNLFTLLVGPPASGKSNAIKPVSELWGKMKGLCKAPDNVTKASMIDALGRAMRTVIHNGGSSATTFCALNVIAPEFGVFFTHHDLEFLSVLNHIYDDPPSYKEERRTVDPVNILRPHMVILAGTQPDYLGTFLPDEAWGMGFASRLIMIYAGECPTGDFFAPYNNQTPELITDLHRIFELDGEFEWEEAARNEINSWRASGCPPRPTHGKLTHYVGRRAVHTAKLAMISCVSRGDEMVITMEDIDNAREWLIENEKNMPDIFKAMNMKSDGQIIKELHHYLYQMYATTSLDKRKPIHEKVIWRFLENKVPSPTIPKIIEGAEKGGYIQRAPYPDEWIPVAMDVSERS